MEDVIYIIILAAWVLFAFYRKSQKKKTMKPAGSGQEAGQGGQGKSMPTLEEILFGEEAIPEKKHYQRPVPVFEEGNYAPEAGETEFEKEYKRLGIDSIEKRTRGDFLEKIELSEIQKNEISDEINMKDSADEIFDLRRAVIYSEILNRPYV